MASIKVLIKFDIWLYQSSDIANNPQNLLNICYNYQIYLKSRKYSFKIHLCSESSQNFFHKFWNPQIFLKIWNFLQIRLVNLNFYKITFTNCKTAPNMLKVEKFSQNLFKTVKFLAVFRKPVAVKKFSTSPKTLFPPASLTYGSPCH